MDISSKYCKVFVSDGVTRRKYDELHQLAVSINQQKNKVSELVCSNLLKYLDMKPLNFVTEMRYMFKGEINACVGGNAQVYGNADVYGDAEVYMNARVYGNTQVYDNARVCDCAEVSGDAEVTGNAIVTGHAVICGNAMVYGDANISDNVIVKGNANVHDNAVLFGDVTVFGDATVFGNAIICGNAEVGSINDYLVFKNNWSSGRYFTWTRSNDKWKVGCFYGTGKELIEKAYADSQQKGDCYKATVDYVENICKLIN